MRVDKIVGKDANSAVNVEKGLVVTGVATASNIETTISSNSDFFEMDNEATISNDTTLSRASGNAGIIYTKFQQVVVAATKSLIVDAGEVLVVDAYGLRTPDNI